MEEVFLLPFGSSSDWGFGKGIHSEGKTPW